MKKYSKKNKIIENRQAFGLMEVVLAVAILAIVSLVVFLSVNSEDKIGKAQDAKRVEDLARISRAIELYQLDNDELPEFFDLEDLAQGEKRVLCSSAATLSCDGQNLSCVVVSGDFLTNYLSSLPVDPSKESALDSGYYISRQGDRQIVFGACQSYGTALELTARAALPDYVSSAYCGDASCNGEENCQTCPEDCGECPIYDYQIAAGSDDWYVHTTQGTVDDATTLLATYNAVFEPAVTSFSYADINTSALSDDAVILEADLYLYLHDYTTGAPPKTAQPTKTFYIQVFSGSQWHIIHNGTFLSAGWYFYKLTSGQLAYINKTGKTRFLIGVEDPGAGYSRELSIRSYEYAGDYSMYLNITVVE
ncbi:MAG: hypothetical protein PHO91_00045 [Patescibacteria group bacterium]|nr:hypothetical protein [Patescibacteria group bacterium]